MATDMEVGLIGCGDMGKLYARKFSAAGYNVCVCDLPEKYESLLEELKGSTITVLRDGFQVSRRCDFIIYSVEAENIAKVVSVYGPATKIGAVVAGQTSVKEPEIRAFEKYLPEDVDIMTLHSLHGPSINPEGQALVVVKHRISDEKFNTIVEMCRNSLKSQIVHLSSYLEHDRITADTQAVTHLAFLSMGSAWKNSKVYPWRSPSYVGGIENVKMLMTLRIFSNKYHVYAGLAILNPSAQNQVRQYASSVTDLFKLIVQERKDELRERLVKAGEFVFGKSSSSAILLSDDVLKEFSLSQVPVNERKPNSHLSLLAMTDSWYQLKINPYDNLLCQTPLFRMWLGIVEYLFKNKEMFDAAIEAAISSKEIRTDDLEFAMATREWANMINESNFEGYKRRFLDASEFFAGQLSEGNKMSAKLIAKLRESGTNFPPAAPSSTISSLPPSPSTMPTSIKYIKAVLVYEDQDVYVDIDAKVSPPNKDCDVSAVFTFDEWKATRTKNGRFIKSTGEESLYRVSIFVTHIPKSTKMWFALKMIDFKNTSQEPIWDNNNYWNFEVVPDKLPQICLPSKQPPAPPAPPQATSPPPQFPPQNPPEKIPQICSPPKDTIAPKPIAAKPPIAPKPQYPAVTSPPPVLQTQQFQHPPHVPSNLIPQNSQFQQLLQSQQLSIPYQSQSLFSQPQSHSPFSQSQQSHSLFSQPHQSQSFFSQPHQSIFPSTQSFLPSPNSLFQHTTPTKTYQQSQQFPYQLTHQTTQLPITQLFQSSKSQPNFQLQSSHLQQQYQELQHYQKQKPIFTCQQQQAQQQNSLYSHQHDSRFYTAQTPSIRSPTSPPPQPELSLQKPAQSRTSPKQKQLTMQQITLEITNTSWQYDEFFRDCFPDHSICSMMKGHRRIYDEFVLQH